MEVLSHGPHFIYFDRIYYFTQMTELRSTTYIIVMTDIFKSFFVVSSIVVSAGEMVSLYSISIVAI